MDSQVMAKVAVTPPQRNSRAVNVLFITNDLSLLDATLPKTIAIIECNPLPFDSFSRGPPNGLTFTASRASTIVASSNPPPWAAWRLPC